MKFKIPFMKEDNAKLEDIEEEIDLLEFEINLRFQEMADYTYKDNPAELKMLKDHVRDLQEVLNEKMKVKAEIEREKHKPMISPDTAAKAVLTVVSLGGIYLLQRDGIIDHAMEKFIPRY